MEDIYLKLGKLRSFLQQKGRVAVAFSGGVDSTFLLKVAHEVLGNNVLAITARSGLFPVREMEESRAFTSENKIQHIICDIDELKIDGFIKNPPDRCYLCKKTLFRTFLKVASDHGFIYLSEGSNTDDAGDYRPGMKAIKELGVLSPLKESGFSKEEIRQLSREMGLPTWEKPSFACLASRFPYGEPITREKLNTIEKAEKFLFDLGFQQIRVRYHGNLARIEVAPGEMDQLMVPEMRRIIDEGIKKTGFTYVSVDLQGYRTGSMNESLNV
ncbi:MAG: ATP-dependent sacrificial sulfur transferase LarE [Bacteroidales bacterium]|nr:ATP-dependent sacrificial sulfur transferase LarE [Bacteroidales bacterium]